jgi:hypothetical protein
VNSAGKKASADAATKVEYKEGGDYMVYDRVRITDKFGFGSNAT